MNSSNFFKPGALCGPVDSNGDRPLLADGCPCVLDDGEPRCDGQRSIRAGRVYSQLPRNQQLLDSPQR